MTGKIAYLSQSELADLLGVDRTTVGAWQREGMPYESQGRGKPGRYCAPVCINWWYGYEKVKKWKLKKVKDPEIIFLIGYLSGEEGDAEWLHHAQELCAVMGVTGDRFHLAVGIAKGITLALTR